MTAPQPRPRWRGFTRQELALIAVTAVWGGTFLIVHTAMAHTGPMFFVGLRFVSAGLISMIIFRRVLRDLRWQEVGAGAAIGVMIFGGYGLQTAGLQTIDSSMSAFITAFYVPLVPLLQWAVFRTPPRWPTLVGIGLAFIGLLLVAGPGAAGLHLGEGEILTLVSTLPIAGEIILISLFTSRFDIGRLTIIQLMTAGLLGFAAMPVVGEGAPEFSWVWLVAGIGMGAASCIIQLTMTWAQRSVSATRATIIYTGEPVWAGVVGRIAGERIAPLAIVGAALIVAGTLVSELRPRTGGRAAASEGAEGAAGAERPEPPA
ncbi:drug/metabolite transporter (DMT)-like permease [Microbacterium resistens]|uniref:Drug/metabolite transporter (DMT)-like permease n=1 Tax=Microbacterium resistens TaxID=156977 RepID=A0ABU1SIK3_9MICO|nr:DMT family transporter [Microbacterium resistens]MDR6868838.1 drug/metabolite transporter (DMT)-like permease [Microbacterium resistens]